MKANVLSPPKNPTPTQTMNMKPDKIRIVDSKATSRKCDQPGVVGENESYRKQNEKNYNNNQIENCEQINRASFYRSISKLAHFKSNRLVNISFSFCFQN